MPDLLDSLKRDPEQVDGLAVEALPELLDECATDHERVALIERRARSRLSRELATSAHGTDRLLSIGDAATRLAVTRDWLRRRGHLPFVVKLSDGTVRYSLTGITRYIAQLQGH